MYALALWNPNIRELILARDPMGIKPLSRTIIDGSLLFASEIKAFQAHENHLPVMDNIAMAARLVWEYPLDGALKNAASALWNG